MISGNKVLEEERPFPSPGVHENCHRSHVEKNQSITTNAENPPRIPSN
jgi:hypothetical protein